jgi:hypothetical protein
MQTAGAPLPTRAWLAITSRAGPGYCHRRRPAARQARSVKGTFLFGRPGAAELVSGESQTLGRASSGFNGPCEDHEDDCDGGYERPHCSRGPLGSGLWLSCVGLRRGVGRFRSGKLV